jgi:hypothetical protein
MAKLLLKSLFTLTTLLALALFSPNQAAAQFMPFGFAGDVWNSPPQLSGCGGCWPSAPTVIETDRAGSLDCCQPLRATSNFGGCKPGCGPCKGGGEPTTMNQIPSGLADGKNRANSKHQAINSRGQVLGVEHVVPMKRKPQPVVRDVSHAVAKRFPENDGWIPVTRSVISSQDQRGSSTR